MVLEGGLEKGIDEIFRSERASQKANAVGSEGNLWGGEGRWVSVNRIRGVDFG